MIGVYNSSAQSLWLQAQHMLTHTAHVNFFLSIGTGGLVLNHTHLPNPASTASAVCVQSCTQVETSKPVRHTLTATDTEQVGTICILSLISVFLFTRNSNHSWPVRRNNSIYYLSCQISWVKMILNWNLAENWSRVSVKIAWVFFSKDTKFEFSTKDQSSSPEKWICIPCFLLLSDTDQERVMWEAINLVW